MLEQEISEENKSGDGQGVHLDYDDSASTEETPDGSGEELAGVPVTVSFAMPKAPVVLRAAAAKKTTVRYRGYISANAQGPHDKFQGANITRKVPSKGVYFPEGRQLYRCVDGRMPGVAYRVYSKKASAQAANEIYAAGVELTTKKQKAGRKR